jgi:2-phospho-L-lactate guanylyltransferase
VTAFAGIWAVVPVKEFADAKQRLASVMSSEQRRALCTAMLEDVLSALAQVTQLGGILLVTLEPLAIGLAARYGARVRAEGARDGHTGAVASAARFLAREGATGMLTVPGDIPAITPSEVAATLAAHRPAPSFTIVPAHDDLGSNAIVCSPADAVPLRFGENSFFPHLAAARQCGIEPTVERCAGIGMDIDHPVDVGAFLRMAAGGRTRALDFLKQFEIARRLG